MVEPQKKVYLLTIHNNKGERLYSREMDQSTGFDLFEKIMGVYAVSFLPVEHSTTAITLYELYPTLHTKLAVLQLYVYPDKLQDLIQYCQPKLF